jgi:FtsP/CotA-like multicopper oxidase with cupredoxin domain
MRRDDSRALSIGAFGVAVVAMVFAAVLLVTRNSNTSTSGSAATTIPTVSVQLAALKIVPAVLNIPTGGAELDISNVDTQAHALAIRDLGVNTPLIQPGANFSTRVTPNADGTFQMYCTVPGHKEAGMVGTVVVGGSASSSATTMANMTSDSATMTAAQSDQMDAQMLAVAQKFPAKTAGHGGDRMTPKILADGTKEFDVTAEIVPGEVSPGKIVQAWTYNGVVPGPEIHVNVGDKVEVVLTNHLPESTTIHFHGIRVPNNMDGVDPYTQSAVKPGETFTYAFTALEPAVGIYHSHHDAAVQVPNGMFGAFTIGDPVIPDVLKAKGYTRIDKTVNMVLNDAGTIGLSLNGKSFPATEPYTLKVGQVMAVNYFNEGLMIHPMHLHQPVGWIIEKDGVPLLAPEPGDTISIAPGERYTVLYKAVDPGVWAWHCHILTHAESSTGMFGMVTALIVEQ